MSATPPCTPIHNINEDVLLYIFAVNADMFADTKALHTTRITSQVCREWRDMMLNAPSLWARLIDMDAFHQSSTPRWWNELMKRSGTALLWIRAHSGLFMLWHTHPTDRSQRLERFFYRVVSRNWHRIQRLVIHGNNSNFGLARAMVSSPAPQLEDFEAPLQKETEAVRAADRHFRERSTACIFASRAPLLRRFRSVGYIADRRAPWLRYLHVIELDRTYNVYDALRVLSATRRLQEIRIADVIDGNLSKTLRSVSLPCLKYLKYEGFPQPGARLLDHIKIPPGCSITIHISHPSNCTRFEEMRQHLLYVVNIFRRHIERHLQSHPFNTLCLTFAGYQSISFGGKTANAVECLFEISIPLILDYGSTQLSMFMNQIGGLDFSRITKLQLHARGFLLPDFRAFFSSLRSLEAICTDSETLQNLTDMQGYISIETIFPLLKTIELVILLLWPITDQIKVAGKFLLSGIKSGYPVATLDMATHSPLTTSPDLNAFADFEDIMVLYKCSGTEGIFEYIGGSGGPT